MDYKGLHCDLCAMRNRVAGYLADIHLAQYRAYSFDLAKTEERLQGFEQECRDFMEEVWPRVNA